MQPSRIDMLTPSQVCDQLQIEEAVLIDAVNACQLPAYHLGDGIRFKAVDVARLSSRLAAA